MRHCLYITAAFPCILDTSIQYQSISDRPVLSGLFPDFSYLSWKSARWPHGKWYEITCEKAFRIFWLLSHSLSMMTSFEQHLSGKAEELLTKCEALWDTTERPTVLVHFIRPVPPFLFKSEVKSQTSQNASEFACKKKETALHSFSVKHSYKTAARKACSSWTALVSAFLPTFFPATKTDKRRNWQKTSLC